MRKPAPDRLIFSYNLAYALFGGLTPLLVSWLVHFDRIGPAHYIADVTIVGLAAMLMAPSHRHSDPNSRLILTSLVSNAITRNPTRSVKRCMRKTSIRNAENRYPTGTELQNGASLVLDGGLTAQRPTTQIRHSDDPDRQEKGTQSSHSELARQ